MGSVGAGLGAVVGSIIGHGQASGDQAQAQQLAEQAYAQMQSLGVPPDMAKQVILQQYKSAGTLTPELENAINLGPSAVANISEDPSLRNAQMSALQQLQQRGQTGMTATDQLNQLKAMNDVNANTEAQKQSIIQGAQARGESGSGAALAAQLLAAQGGANSAESAGLQNASNASQNALNAITQSGQLGGQIRGQDFSTAETKANAADQFQRFNVQNQQQVANQNVSTQNQAQQYNLNNAQQLSNANVGNANQEALRENAGQMTTWDANLTRDKALANASLGYSQQMQGEANAIQNQAAGMGGAIGGAIGAGAQAIYGMPSFGGGASSGNTNLSGTSGAGTSQTYANQYGAPGANYNGGPVQTFDEGGVVQSLAQLAPLAMFLNNGGQVESCYDDGGQIQASAPMGGSDSDQTLDPSTHDESPLNPTGGPASPAASSSSFLSRLLSQSAAQEQSKPVDLNSLKQKMQEDQANATLKQQLMAHNTATPTMQNGGPVYRSAYMFDDGGNVPPPLDPDKVKSFESGYDQSAGDRTSKQLHNLASALGFASGGVIKDEEKMPINDESTSVGKKRAIYNAHPLNEQNLRNFGNPNLSEHYLNTSNSGNSIPPSQYAMGGPAQSPQLSPQQMRILAQKLAMMKQSQAMPVPQRARPMLNAQHGSLVPGQASVPGDNLANDKVHALVSPDEIVLPRSITTKPDAAERAKEFVKGILAAKRNHRY